LKKIDDETRIYKRYRRSNFSIRASEHFHLPDEGAIGTAAGRIREKRRGVGSSRIDGSVDGQA
jgi:hypothetical protein